MSKNDGGSAITLDLESLRGHTPGPWTWWTSCSFRRLSYRGDGDVLCAVTQSDGHPDVFLNNGGWEGPDGLLIAAAPDLFSECERLRAELTARRARDADVGALVAAAKRANGDHTAPHDCYATGPSTGDDYLDLVSCPGCELAAALLPFAGDKT